MTAPLAISCAALFLAFAGNCWAQQAVTAPAQAQTPYSVVRRDGNTRIWQRSVYQASPSGQTITNLQSYTEVGSGLCYLGANGQWLDSQEVISILPDGSGAATNGQHSVYFPIDVANGKIKLVEPGGAEIESEPLSLTYFDGTNYALIGELTNSTGELISENQVLYTNAFFGVNASLLYTYTKAGLEQDVILGEQPPTPQSLGLDPDTARLQVATEFFNAPEPTVSATTVPTLAGDIEDDSLSFGTMAMVAGRAFVLGQAAPSAMIDRQWVSQNGEQVLVEEVPVASINDQLASLPLPRASSRKSHSPRHIRLTRQFPSPKRAGRPSHRTPGRISWAKGPDRGVVLDYQMINDLVTNYTFQGDTTYYVSNFLALYGTSNVFEGGAVIKFATNTVLVIVGNGPGATVQSLTANDRPVIFTASDDNTIGNEISGSTGNPQGYYANTALELEGIDGSSGTLRNLRISYAKTGIGIFQQTEKLFDVQLMNCGTACYVGEGTATIENALFGNDQCDFFLDFSEAQATNATFATLDFGSTLEEGDYSDLYVANSILANVTNSGSASGDHNGFYISSTFGLNQTNSSSYPFEAVGGGSYYLTTNCAFRSFGTANIDPVLLADLQSKTTQPPIVYSNTDISSLGTLSPCVPRDTNSTVDGTVDLGWHYDALDFAFGGCSLSNNLPVTAGTAVGCFGYGSLGPGFPYGIAINNGGGLTFEGNATQPCIFAFADMVQEGGNWTWTNGEGGGFLGGLVFNGTSAGPEPLVSANFTRWTADNYREFFNDSPGYGAGSFENCEFYNCSASTYEMQYLIFTNCLFFRNFLAFWDPDYALSFTFENCTFYNGCLAYDRHAFEPGELSSFWRIENCSFDGTAFNWLDFLHGGTTNTLFDYNAYNTNNLSWTNYPYLSPTFRTNEIGTNDLLVGNYNWEISWFGNFYLPTNSELIYHGSTNAGPLGLYWFTVQTNQTIDGANLVSIGYHYVATDTNGNPLATYGAPNPNYIQYPNGAPTNWLYIVSQPASLTVTQGSTATFSITVNASPSPTYQWYEGGEPLSDGGGISGSASATLTLSGVNPAQGGNYYVAVSNGSGFTNSTSAALTVLLSQGSSYDTPPLYVMPPYAYWNVTDISDPGQPVNIGELQAPFTKPNYCGSTVPPFNTLWHSAIAKASVGEAYGTTYFGGISNKGTVYKIGANGSEGDHPSEMVLVGGTLYGTTPGLDEPSAYDNYGTIFSISTNGSRYTTLLGFNPSLLTATEGEDPEAGLTQSGSAFYGTTAGGGGSGCGTVFCLTNGIVGTLYSFTGPNNNSDGSSPCAKLVLSGNMLYGITEFGGTNFNGSGYGTVFEMDTNGNNYQVLHRFGGAGDGADPSGALVLSPEGVLYGTTSSGGEEGMGTVFCITNGGGYTILHKFAGTEYDDGDSPEGSLLLSNGVLYGTTYAGGSNGAGTVFSIIGTNCTILHSFAYVTNDGVGPVAGLVLSGGMLYGTTESGGAMGAGTVFSVSINGTNAYNNLYSFKDGADGADPVTALLLSGNTLFGTTYGDADSASDPNYGTIFSINTNGGDFTVLDTFTTSGFAVLHSFDGLDGANPCSQLALSGSTFYNIFTTVYGTTMNGGSNGFGTVFKVNTDGTGFTNLYEFNGTNDGKFPQTGLLISAGTLYGTTTNSIFKINTDGSDFTLLWNVTNASQLILSMSGYTLYGTTSNGGSNGCGSVFSINTDGSDFTNFFSFSGTNGQYPNSGLELYGIGHFLDQGPLACTLYGTTYSGGASSNGTVFSINTDGSDFSDLHDFDGTSDGAHPSGGLLVINNNQAGAASVDLFGTTSSEGPNGGGALFYMTLNSEPSSTETFQTLYSFSGANGDGFQPEGRLTFLGSVLYGTTSSGGAYGNGMVFSFDSSGGTNISDLYDFSGGNDGRTPLAGLAMPVVDNPISIWSLDTTINISDQNLTNLAFSAAIDNCYALYVNGTLVQWVKSGDCARWSPFASMPCHQGENDVRVVINDDGDDDATPTGTGDYFAMQIKSSAVFTNLFGTTFNGGVGSVNGNGTVFEITPEGTETVLYAFSNSPYADGANPVGDLVLSGNTLYGVTENGGKNLGNDGYGTIFSLAIGSTEDEVLHYFTNGSDGANPFAGLILSNSTLYGTTANGGTNGGYGTVFRINTDGSGYSVLYSFAGGNNNDGANPEAPLVLAGTNLYGTTYGSGNNGTIFSISVCTNGPVYSNLYYFGTTTGDGVNPQAGLIFSNNTLYGTTFRGGANNDGTVFSFTLGSATDAVLHAFSSQPSDDGYNPEAGLVLSGSTLYGAASVGGVYGQGTIFSIDVNGGGYTTLLSLGSSDSNLGQNPKADLFILGNSLYGTTYQGGYGGGNGMVFSVNTNGGAFNDIHDFTNSPDGANPQGGLCSP